MKGEEGRDVATYGSKGSDGENRKDFVGSKMNASFRHSSLFDPVLCEVVYHWFTSPGDKILDPFAGGCVGGIVAGAMGREYTGIELRPEQVAANREQAKRILSNQFYPEWIEGDSVKKILTLTGPFDLIFSCPPYGDLEKYSELEGDISNMSYSDFLDCYSKIIRRACGKLKPGGYAVFVVGEFRDKKTGVYRGFVQDTIFAFCKAGMEYYNEIILYTSLGTAGLRADTGMKNKKIVKVHQNVLVFRKGE
jgi:hypothetical protein